MVNHIGQNKKQQYPLLSKSYLVGEDTVIDTAVLEFEFWLHVF